MEAMNQKTLVLPGKGFGVDAAKEKILSWFHEPADVPVMSDDKAVAKTYKQWRIQIFASCFIGYVIYYLCKKNISAALPAMSAELGYTNTQLGILGSTLYLTYAFGKFINGMMADRANVRTFFPTALLVVGIANLLLVLSSFFITPGHLSFFGLPSATVLLWVMAFFWGCNGWFQSMGFPSIAKSLTYWYSNNERGLKWSLWSTSHQLGTSISVILSGFLIAKLGWQAAFYIPAIIAIIASFVLFNTLRDKPSTMGLPDVEEYREPENIQAVKAKNAADADLSYGEIFKKYILQNKTIWLLAFANIFVYVIRFGTEDWFIKYLVEAKGNTGEVAAYKLSCLPLCGIIGTISVGYISDKFFGSRRAPVNILFLLGVIGCLFALKVNPAAPNFIDDAFLAVTHTSLTSVLHMNGGDLIDALCLGGIGLFTYGPQVLVGGLCAIESSSKKVASASTGFTGSFGYGGAVLSAIGTGLLIDHFKWDGAIYFWMASAVLCILFCLPMWNNKGK